MRQEVNCKKRQQPVFLFYIVACTMWVIMGFSTGHADYINYESYFDRISSGIDVLAVEPGFTLLMKIASTYGLSYIAFQALFALVGFILIGSTLYRYSFRKVAVLFAYFCYPFLLDITQMRQFMVAAIVIFSIRYLEKFSIKNLILFIAVLMISSSIHISSFIYLALLLSYIKDEKKLLRYVLIAAFGFILIGGVVLNSGFYQAIINLRGSDIDYEKGMSGIQLVLYLVFYSLLVFFCVYLHNKKTSRTNCIENDFLYRVCLCTIMFIPFILLDFQFTRLFRTTIIILYIYILNGTLNVGYANKRLYSFVFFTLVLAVGFRLFGPRSGYYQTLTMPILNSNVLFNNF